MPDLSIVIPVYNTEKDYLRSCFASIEACVRAGIFLETIVVDDGSEADYANKLAGILEGYDIRASLHRKANGGQNSARALGAALATGEYLLFVDSDDRLVPGELARVVGAALEMRPKILCFNYDRVTSDGSLLSHCGPWRGGYRVGAPGGRLHLGAPGGGGSGERARLPGNNPQIHSRCMQLYCRESFIESGIHLVEGPRIGEDMASTVALLLAIGEASSIGATPYLYVERPTSALHEVPEERALDIIKSADGMLAQIASDKRERYADELEALCILHVLFWGGTRSAKVSENSDTYKPEFFRWMDGNFPAWRENPYMGELASRYGMAFRLVTGGRWRAYVILFKAKGVLKRLHKVLSTRKAAMGSAAHV